MSRRALLVFADEMHVDLARRSFPRAAHPLLKIGAVASENSSEVDVHIFTRCAVRSGRRSAASLPGGTLAARDATADGPHVHRQAGRDFAARFENAIEKVAELGYEEVVAVGRDCPGLRAVDIERAFIQLATRKLVLGPDHRGGCYLIAFRLADRELLRGVEWKRNTDCAQLRNRCGEEHVSLLPVKHDLDSWADLRLFARTGELLARLASFLLELVCAVGVTSSQFVDLALQRIRVRGQMPPPAFAA